MFCLKAALPKRRRSETTEGGTAADLEGFGTIEGDTVVAPRDWRSCCFVFCSLKLMISEEICGRFGRFDVEIDAYRLSREVGVMLMDR